MDEIELKKLRAWCLGDEAAVAMLVRLGEISQIADDLVDGDQPTAPSADMARLLLLALVDIPNNPFFARYRAYLAPLLTSALLQWDAANDWARDARRESRIYSFVFRCALERCIVASAYLLGGFEHARKVEREMHEYYRYSPDADGQPFEVWEAAEARIHHQEKLH